MVPPCSDRISRVPPYSRMSKYLHIRGYHPLRPDFPDRSAYPSDTTGLFRVRSPLLAESLLMSLPPGTEMFQFPGFASRAYVFSPRYPIGVGCPIRISTDQRLLAAPHGFSQRATSFIASWCQGIHRMPFLCSRIPSSPSTRERPDSPCTGTIPADRLDPRQRHHLRCLGVSISPSICENPADRLRSASPFQRTEFTRHTHSNIAFTITSRCHIAKRL